MDYQNKLDCRELAVASDLTRKGMTCFMPVYRDASLGVLLVETPDGKFFNVGMVDAVEEVSA